MSSPEDDPAATAAARRRRILDAFDQALDMDGSERTRWLAEQFGDDVEAIAAVQTLIEADSVAPSVMPTELPGENGRTMLVAPLRIGPYSLERRIGAGGMGEVWIGVRDDGLFDQKVAVKLMRPSRYASEALAFFDTERRALARMNHRHIARLFDGGITETGIPWFIMELVDGQPLDAYAAGALAGAPPEHAAALAAVIAETVQYAHAQLVVHADIKPSNILVNAAGEPCLVDFGIASLAASAAEQADKAAFPSTPAYASPERVNGAAPTPSDDIFSLGLLLHGLLTGEWPQAPTGGRLSPTGRPVYDALIAKACAPSADDRYATAQAFAADLRAIIEHRPTSLQVGDRRAESRLFVRRHPRGVAAALAAVVATAGALVVIAGLYVVAEHQRDQAQRRFNEVRELAGYLLGDFHDELQKLPGAAGLRSRTTAVGRRYLEKLSAVPDAPLEVQRDVAVGYGRIGAAEATTSTNAAGDVRKGEAALARSEALLRDLIHRYPGRDDFRRELARTLTWRSGVYLSAHNDAPAASSAVVEALGLYDGVLRRKPDDVDAAYGRWNAVLGRGDVLAGANQREALAALMRDTLERYRGLPAPERLRAQRALLEAATENNLGDAAFYLESPDAGVAHYLKARALVQGARSGGLADMRLPMREAFYDYQLSTSYQSTGRPQAALDWAGQGKAVIDDLARYDDSAATLHIADMLSLQRASVLGDLGRARESLAEAESSVARRRQALVRRPEDMDNQLSLASALHTLAKHYVRAGEPLAACRSVRESLSLFERLARAGGVPERNNELDVVPQRAIAARCPP